MNANLTESMVEQAALTWLEVIGWQITGARVRLAHFANVRGKPASGRPSA